MTDLLPSYLYSRFVFERGLALMYLVAFICAVNQFVPLLGEHGLLPVTNFVRAVPFRATPSLFFFAPRDIAFRAAAWIGVAVSALMLIGLPQMLGSIASAAGWFVLWVLYLSFVNVGQTFYAFGWESLLLETGFFAIFAGGFTTTPNALLIWIWRWVAFRIMFGAGLIKMRGDPCWRDLTCLDYYFETQPIPNSLSWSFHWLPHWVHHTGVVINHVVELGVPFLFFAPQPIAAIGGIVTIAFQLVLILSGNLSWLNWLTIVLCIPAIDDRWWSWLPITMPQLQDPGVGHRALVGLVTAGVAILSVAPIMNMLSPNQVMNTSFNTIHLVNTYGAFGSITRTRTEIVLEGTSDPVIGPTTTWRAYEFKGKPGDPMRRPIQIAPYHLRLDWLMWFAAMSTPEEHPWFPMLLGHLLLGDTDTLSLLASDPFPGSPPQWIRARYFEYHFTTPEEHRRTGAWWTRKELGLYMPPVRLQQGAPQRP